MKRVALKFGQMLDTLLQQLLTIQQLTFLVTLRNEMSEQLGQWENTSLIFLCDTLNDSIQRR